MLKAPYKLFLNCLNRFNVKDANAEALIEDSSLAELTKPLLC